MLRQVSEVPPRKLARKFEPFCARDIREFARSGMQAAELVYTGRSYNPEYVARKARQYIEAAGLGDRVAVDRRKEHVYLSRKPEAR